MYGYIEEIEIGDDQYRVYTGKQPVVFVNDNFYNRLQSDEERMAYLDALNCFDELILVSGADANSPLLEVRMKSTGHYVYEVLLLQGYPQPGYPKIITMDSSGIFYLQANMGTIAFHVSSLDYLDSHDEIRFDFYWGNRAVGVNKELSAPLYIINKRLSILERQVEELSALISNNSTE